MAKRLLSGKASENTAPETQPKTAETQASTAPWQPGPRIRHHLQSQVPQVPEALLACYDPVTPGLR